MGCPLKSFALFFMLTASVAGAQERARSDSVPRAHFPPAGMCRIWLDGVPAERQSAPTDCVTAVRNRPTNGRVVFGADAKHNARLRPMPGATPFRAGSAINGSCVDRNNDGVCDETWARPTEPLRPVTATGSQSATQEPASRPARSAEKVEKVEKVEKPKEP